MTDIATPVSRWLRDRLDSTTVRWAYNPRTSELNTFIRGQFVHDLLATSMTFARAAGAGKTCCNFGASVAPLARRPKKLDVIVGLPEQPLMHIDGPDPLRIARVGEPWLALEVKLCMTAHGRARTRLIQELAGSLDAVREASPTAAALAIVLVNSSTSFFSPLNRPGPNVHPESAARTVVEELAEVFGGDQGADSYRSIAFSLIDFDNDTRSAVVPLPAWIPPKHSYEHLMLTARQVLEAHLGNVQDSR